MPQEESPYQLTGHPTRNHRPLYEGQDCYKLQLAETIQAQRTRYGCWSFGESVNSLPHHESNSNIVTTRSTPAFLITTPKCHEPQYYFPLLRRHRQPKSRNTTRTCPPPYIRLPKPHPISPNIHTRLHRRSLANQHPPDIRTPRPIPPKPNISIRLPTFQQSHHSPGIRPCRKHSPHSLIPRHYCNVIRRISKKGHLHQS